MVRDKVMTLYFTIAIPTTYDRRRAWHKKKSLGMLRLDSFCDTHLHGSSTPDSGRTTREGQDGCSKGTVARGRKLGKGSARAAEGAVPVFSSDLPNSPGCAATQTSQFNIRSSQVRPRKKSAKFLLTEQTSISALMLLPGAPLSGGIEARKWPCAISWLIRTAHDCAHVPF